MANTHYEIEQRIKSLPEKVQNVLRSKELLESMRALAKKHKLYYDKWEILENEVMQVLLSIKSPADLPATLGSLGLKPDDAQALLKDLIEHIFKPMRKLLKEALDDNLDSDNLEAEVDPRAPQFHGTRPDPKLGANLDKPFNLGEIEQVDDPYLEPIDI